ncbi:MAG: hypothetical protein HYZ75_19400 [Elusimicrobia bacterium]|nr:hypothetical protein [Elusimicrobiota bacterium]
MRTLCGLALASLLSGCLSGAPRRVEPPGRSSPPAEEAGAARRRAVVAAQRLYDQGVDAYARGEMKEAERFFEEALQRDPGHAPAQKALRRLAQPAP